MTFAPQQDRTQLRTIMLLIRTHLFKPRFSIFCDADQAVRPICEKHYVWSHTIVNKDTLRRVVNNAIDKNKGRDNKREDK